jgi:hypothetical protein
MKRLNCGVIGMAALMLSSCADTSKPGSDSCVNVDCDSHGACVNGICNCTDNYTGDHCQDPPSEKSWHLVDISEQVPTEMVTTAFGASYWNSNDGVIQAWASDSPQAPCAADINGCVRLYRHTNSTFSALPSPSGLQGLSWFSICTPHQDQPTRAFAVARVGATAPHVLTLDVSVPNPAWVAETSAGVGLAAGDALASIMCLTSEEMIAVGDTGGEPSNPIIALFTIGTGWTQITVPPAENTDSFLFDVSIDVPSEEGWVTGVQFGAGRTEMWPVLYHYLEGSIVADDSLLATSGWPDSWPVAESVFTGSGLPRYVVAMSNGSDVPALVFEYGVWTVEDLPKPATGDAVACAQATGASRNAFMLCSAQYSCTSSILSRPAGGAWTIIAEGHGSDTDPGCHFDHLFVRDEDHLLVGALTPLGAAHDLAVWELNRE